MLSKESLAVLMLLRQAWAIEDMRPFPTAFGDLGAEAIQAVMPKVTGAIQYRNPKLARQASSQASTPDTICAYVSGNAVNPLICSGTVPYCGYRTDLGVMGCCETFSQLANGDFTLTSCEFFTRCYDSTAASTCTGSCLSNPLNGFCTRGAFPYCMTYSVTDLSLSSIACNTGRGVTTEAALYPTITSSAARSTSTTSNAPANVDGNASTNAGGAGSNPTSTVYVVPNGSGSSGSKSVVGPAVGGAVGGFVALVLAAALFWWLRIKQKKSASGPSHDTAAAGAGVGAGAAAGAGAGAAAAQGRTEYYGGGKESSMHTTPVNNEPAPPMYQTPPMAQTHSNGNLNVPMASPVPSEMPGSPAPLGGQFSPQQTYSEVEGSNVPGSAAAQRSSVGSPSVVSGSADDHRVGGSTVSGPTASSQGTAPNNLGLGHQAGPVGDFNRPYHELE